LWELHEARLLDNDEAAKHRERSHGGYLEKKEGRIITMCGKK
jgi:hypothetical protein